MKRLRHPIRAIREPFGTAGLVVAVIALILAMSGAAFAAAGLNGKQKKEVEKIAKKYAGKNGAPGAVGPQGSAGTAGSNGAMGPTGPTGVEGKQGQRGLPGETGFTSVLPEGETETGAWSVGFGKGGTEVSVISISYALPLEDAPELHYINESGEEQTESGRKTSTVCLGTAAEPEALPGNACVYAEFEQGLVHIEQWGFHPARTGASFFAILEEAAAAAWGTFAVTAPEG